jgi:hypothetical protein
MLTLFTQNPELKRYSCLEIKINKIIILFAIITLIYLTAYSLSWTAFHLSYISISLFHILVSLWGSKEISSALPDEVNEKTWDRQCMTGLSPLKLTIGKLIGPALFQWIGGLVVLIIGVIATLSEGNGSNGILQIINTLLIGMLFNMMALLSSLIIVSGERLSSFSNKKIKTGFFIFIIIIGYSFITTFFRIAGWGGMLFNFTDNESGTGGTYWYNISFNPVVFQIFSLIFFCIWLMIGNFQSMRRELKYINNNNLLWLFIITMVIYCFGLGFNPLFKLKECILLGWFAASSFILIVTYFLMISERENIIEVKKIFSKNPYLLLKKPTDNSPAWHVFIVSSIILLITGMLLFYTHNFDDESRWTDLLLLFAGSIDIKNQSVLFIFCILLLMLRDLYITRYINYFSNFNNKQLAIIIYFATIYGLLPVLFKTAGLVMLLLPSFLDPLYISIISITFQVIIAAIFFGMQLKKNFRD